MIAAALVLDPALLIADEPTTALDVTTQAQILKLVREMQGRKKTGVLFITHDFGVVSEIADRVVVMQLGSHRGAGPLRAGAAQPARRLHQDAAGRGAEHDAAEAHAGERSRGAANRETVQDLRQALAVPAEGADRQRGQRRFADGAARRNARHCRRIRFRQVDGGALRRAAGAADQRRDPDRQRRHRVDEGSEIPRDAAAGAVRFSGSLPVAQSAPHGRRSHHRGADEFWPSRARKPCSARAT